MKSKKKHWFTLHSGQITNQRIDSMKTVNEECERCRLCNQLISIENEKLPLDEGVCYNCMFGPTGDPEEHEDR